MTKSRVLAILIIVPAFAVTMALCGTVGEFWARVGISAIAGALLAVLLITTKKQFSSSRPVDRSAKR